MNSYFQNNYLLGSIPGHSAVSVGFIGGGVGDFGHLVGTLSFRDAAIREAISFYFLFFFKNITFLLKASFMKYYSDNIIIIIKYTCEIK